MVRRLPCPVCGCESFIESATQGGLICTDCGAVSNQVEIADDEDAPIAGQRTFISALSYKHVTEEESKARRERKVVLRLEDSRSPEDLLQAMGLILDHMIGTSISNEVCPPEAREAVRESWIDFLSSVADSESGASLSAKTGQVRLATQMAKWGIGSDFREVATRGLPTDRRKQIQGLHQRLDDRQLSSANIVVYSKAPLFIYAHDWLCLFLKIDTFPIPDWVLRDYAAHGASWRLVNTIRQGESRSLRKHVSGTLTQVERRALVRRFFVDIISDDSIRSKHCGLDTPESPKSGALQVDLECLLSVLILGLRRININVLPIHVLNWIARGDLEYFSAHKCLNAPLDRLEYYRVRRTAHAYKRSVFCPSRCPTVAEMETSLEALESLGLDAKIRDPVGLLGPCLDMLGLLSLHPLCLRITESILTRIDEPLFEPLSTDNRKKLASMTSRSSLMRKSFFAADVEVNEFVFTVIAVGMKLAFPELHPPNEGENLKHALLDLIPSEPIVYEIMSSRFTENGQSIDTEWWHNLTVNERNQFLGFIETENLEELRDSLVEDLRVLLDPEWDNRSTAAEAQKLSSGPLKTYTLCSETEESGTMKYLLQDIAKACGASSNRNLSYAVRQLELLLFP